MKGDPPAPPVVTGGLTPADIFAGAYPNADDEVLQAWYAALSGSPCVEPAQSPEMQAAQPLPSLISPPFKLSRSPSPRIRLDSQEMSQFTSAALPATLLSKASSTEPTRLVHEKPALEDVSMS